MVQIGRLSLPSPAGRLGWRNSFDGVRILHLTLDRVRGVGGLELHHGDPYDRILIAQSMEEKLNPMRLHFSSHLSPEK
jgi:PIN domain nuclease of toxin-antitoxin system